LAKKTRKCIKWYIKGRWHRADSRRWSNKKGGITPPWFIG
jgi:hypothetical protein